MCSQTGHHQEQPLFQGCRRKSKDSLEPKGCSWTSGKARVGHLLSCPLPTFPPLEHLTPMIPCSMENESMGNRVRQAEHVFKLFPFLIEASELTSLNLSVLIWNMGALVIITKWLYKWDNDYEAPSVYSSPLKNVERLGVLTSTPHSEKSTYNFWFPPNLTINTYWCHK